MVAGSTASRKAKGREHQKKIAGDIRTAFGLPEVDVVSRPMGSHGLDIMMSERARALFPYGIECKRTEKLSIPAWWEQCWVNAESEGLRPLLVYKRNREEAMVVMRWVDFLKVVNDA